MPVNYLYIPEAKLIKRFQQIFSVHDKYVSPMTILLDCLELLFPSYCLTCSAPLAKGEDWVCTICCYDLPQTNYHQGIDNIIAQKLYGRLPIKYALSLYKFRKKSKVQALLHHIKYRHKPVIAKWLGRRYGVILKETSYKSPDLIVPVPLHDSKFRQRGYNQSDYFAQGIAEVLKVPWSNQCLVRKRATSTQTKKNQLERFENVEGAFDVTDTLVIRDKHLLVVDDVITTGATLEACVTVLLAAGSRAISVATIAVAE